MIEKLVLTNFRKFKKFSVELSPRITTLSGESNRGKTCLVRAIRWICLNKPSGTSCIKHGEKSCSVRLKVDSRLIKRERSKQDNSYCLDSEEYKALGQGGVPEPVSKFLCISDINFQLQHDRHFWFHLSPGEVGKEINNIVNLSLIDRSLGFISQEVRKAKNTVSVSEDRLKLAKEEVEKLIWVDKAESELEQILHKNKEIEKLESLTKKLLAVTQNLAKSRSQQEFLTNQIKLGAGSIAKATRLLELTENKRKLNELCLEIQVNQERVEELRVWMKSLEEEIKEKLKGGCPLCKQTLKQSGLS